MPSTRPPPLDVILPFPAPRDQIVAATRWRSTWVLSSIQTLKERGHFERYRSFLPDEHAEAVLLAVAGVWMPMKVAKAHYLACDELGLEKREIVEMGIASGERAQGGVLRTVIRFSKQGGVTPWTLLPQIQKLWERGADGGGTSVMKAGPKEARLEVIGCALFDIPYFRAAFSGVVQGILRTVSARVYVHDITPALSRSACLLALQWV
jgi:hypothetical protein